MYSNMHGRSCCCRHWLHTRSPSSVTITISPGCTSRTRLKPIGPNAQSSDAMHHSGPSGVRRVPSTSGRMPFGSRKATSPTPLTRHMQEKAPSRSYMHRDMVIPGRLRRPGLAGAALGAKAVAPCMMGRLQTFQEHGTGLWWVGRRDRCIAEERIDVTSG